MRATTHAAFGFAFVIAAGTAMGVRLGPAVAAFTTLGALLPDIDTPTSLVADPGGDALGRASPPASGRPAA